MKSRRKSAFSSFFKEKKENCLLWLQTHPPSFEYIPIYMIFCKNSFVLIELMGILSFFLQNSTSIKSRKLEEFSFNISFIKKEFPIWEKMGCFLESTFDYFNKIAKNGLKRKVPIYGVFLLAISSCPIKKQTTGK